MKRITRAQLYGTFDEDIAMLCAQCRSMYDAMGLQTAFYDEMDDTLSWEMAWAVLGMS